MKIYFNRRPVGGPWGGGSKVLGSIIQECTRRGHHLFFEEQLSSVTDLDLIFCIDPRQKEGVGYRELLDYKTRRKVKIVQRVGDLGTHGKPDLLKLVQATTVHSDVLVFPSHWAMKYLGIFEDKSIVISNAPLKCFVENRKNSSISENISVVSHHWSNNDMKGFDVYKKIDEKDDIPFTFIGRIPDGMKLRNHVPPQDIQGLVREIPKHDVYITASKKEAGANHVLEAMALGLPVLYHEDGGSINEYCAGYGISYKTPEEAMDILKNRRKDLEDLSKNVYSRTSDDMSKEYVDVLEEQL